MKIKITYESVRLEDRTEDDYMTFYNGREIWLGNRSATAEANARKRFGDDVEIEWVF